MTGYSRPVRILLLADTHLGFDLPVAPRVKRRRRGDDFLANYATALAPALRGEVDLVVHAGDVFNRSRPHASVAWQAFEPLTRVADAGIPVFVVPGNHERSRLPHLRFARHPRIHVFAEPGTHVTHVRGVRVGVTGLPFAREHARASFGVLVEQSQWRDADADVRLLCLHQAVEGATVGPANFTFRDGDDVIRGADIPRAFDAVLAGHIHRHQVLTHDLAGRALPAPVLYPGSIERTSFAEADEAKGYLLLDVVPRAGDRATELTWTFQSLPARSLVRHVLDVTGMNSAGVEDAVRSVIAAAPVDAVLTIRVRGLGAPDGPTLPSAEVVRALAPPTMNVEVRPDGESWAGGTSRTRVRVTDDALSFDL